MMLYMLSVNNSNSACYFGVVILLFLPLISLSLASPSEKTSSNATFVSTLTGNESSSSKKEIQNEYGNANCEVEMVRISERLNHLEKHISLRNSKIEDKEKVTTPDIQALLDLKISELEIKIMDRVSQMLMPIDSKIMEQATQIKDILEMKVIPTTPSPAVISSTLSTISTMKTKKTTATKKPSNISSSSHHKNCSMEYDEVQCENVPIENIKAFFQMNDASITNNLLDSIRLILRSGDESIPADILGNKKTEELVIRYEYREDPTALLKVDLNAFQSTQNYTNSLELRNFDSSQLDLGFLTGFNQLTDLIFNNVRHIQKSLPSLPLLPKLTGLKFDNVGMINDRIITFPTLSTGVLKRFLFINFDEKQTADALVSRMLDWILILSANTVEVLILNGVGITNIPSQIPSFTALKHLDLSVNSIQTIKYGALRFSVPVFSLRLASNKISSIEPGAFQGDFRGADVDLTANPFTRFDEPVFRPLLQQMVSGTGKIYVHYFNNIDCSTKNICHLDWLIRDSKLREKVDGKCSNGTQFSSLKENGFNHCSITKKPK